METKPRLQTTPLTVEAAMATDAGQRFGRLTVREPDPGEHINHLFVPVACTCGSKKSVYAADLKSYRTLSCGCMRKSPRAKKGDRFGSLTYVKTTKDRIGVAEFECDCGTTFNEQIKAVRTGVVTACPACRPPSTGNTQPTNPMEELFFRGVSVADHARHQGITPKDALLRILKVQSVNT